jgi:acyl dehydratase
VGVSDAPDQLADRRRVLREQFVALDDLSGEPLDHPEQLDRVFADADRLMDLVDEIAARTAGRLRWVAFGLLTVAALLAVLVAFGVLPVPVLIAVLLVLVAAVGILYGIRNTPTARS